MMRNLKVLMLAALAVVAVGAVSASAAQAARFTVPGVAAGTETRLTALKDGTGKTAHQVFDIANTPETTILPITCEEVTGEAIVVGPEPADVTVKTPQFKGNCSFLGQAVTVTNIGCDFTFTPGAPQLHIINATGKECKIGKQPITFQTAPPLECKVEVGAQTVEGINYINVENHITLEAKEIKKLKYNATGKDCNFGETENGRYTTGNVTIKGETLGGVAVPIKWDAV